MTGHAMKQSTRLDTREIYAPSHFGNTYEATLPREMTQLLAEAKFWDFNRFSDWFDTIDLYNVYEKRHHLFNMPEAMWARKFANYDRLFRDFTDRGLHLESLSGGAYDYGGCDCEQCRPWIVTFGKLFRQIAELGRQHFGNNLQAELWGWWWTDEDHSAFTDWADAEAPGYFQALVAGLGSGRYPSADAVLRAYAERYFGTDDAGWSELLHAMGDFELLDVSRCRPLFDRLAKGARDGWCLRQIEGRLKLAEAHQSVLSRNEWDSRRMDAAAEFLSVKEHLYRQVWKLGLQRHIFRFESHLPSWHAELPAHKGTRKPKSHLDAHSEA